MRACRDYTSTTETTENSKHTLVLLYTQKTHVLMRSTTLCLVTLYYIIIDITFHARNLSYKLLSYKELCSLHSIIMDITFHARNLHAPLVQTFLSKGTCACSISIQVHGAQLYIITPGCVRGFARSLVRSFVRPFEKRPRVLYPPIPFVSIILFVDMQLKH